MLIGICGSICAGKRTVAQYLVEHHGFKRLYLSEPSSIASADSSLKDDAVDGDLKSDAFTTKDNLSAQAGSELPVMLQPHRGQFNHHHNPEYTFKDPEDLLAYATQRWGHRFVTTDIPTEAVLDIFLRRPFFLLISIDAPLTVRWKRFRDRSDSTLSLKGFVDKNDVHLYDAVGGLQPLISRATVRLLNTSSSLAHLYATLGKIDIPNPDRLRPSWDTYFMALASLAAQRSNCMKRRVGCVIVGRERRVISTGYNGTPRGLRNCAEGGCPRCNEGSSSGVGLATCLCIHAEENALLEAGRERIRDGAVLYCDTCPCLTCSIKICQVGISEVVYAYGYSMDKQAAQVFREAGVKLRQFIPAPNGLIHLEKQNFYEA